MSKILTFINIVASIMFFPYAFLVLGWNGQKYYSKNGFSADIKQNTDGVLEV